MGGQAQIFLVSLLGERRIDLLIPFSVDGKIHPPENACSWISIIIKTRFPLPIKIEQRFFCLSFRLICRKKVMVQIDAAGRRNSTFRAEELSILFTSRMSSHSVFPIQRNILYRKCPKRSLNPEVWPRSSCFASIRLATLAAGSSANTLPGCAVNSNPWCIRSTRAG